MCPVANHHTTDSRCSGERGSQGGVKVIHEGQVQGIGTLTGCYGSLTPLDGRHPRMPTARCDYA